MNIEKSIQIAVAVANEAPAPKPASPEEAAPEPDSDESTQENSDSINALLVAESIKTVRAIAAGGDPYTLDAGSRNKPENNPETVKALCIVSEFLLQRSGVQQKTSVAPVMSETRGSLSLDDYLSEIERREILEALNQSKFNKTEAARILGITFRSLRYKLERLGIE